MSTYKLYYPSVDKNGIPLEQLHANNLYKRVCSEFCQLAGRLTVYPVSGMYINSTGKLITDDISLIQCYCDKTNEMVKLLHDTAKLVLSELNQESVMIEVNNKIEFITG